MKKLTKKNFKTELSNAANLNLRYQQLMNEYPGYHAVLLAAMTEVMLEKAGI